MHTWPFAHGIGAELNIDLSFSSINQTIFVPLAAAAGLPRSRTKIAEALATSAGNVKTPLVLARRCHDNWDTSAIAALEQNSRPQE